MILIVVYLTTFLPASTIVRSGGFVNKIFQIIKIFLIASLSILPIRYALILFSIRIDVEIDQQIDINYHVRSCAIHRSRSFGQLQSSNSRAFLVLSPPSPMITAFHPFHLTSPAVLRAICLGNAVHFRGIRKNAVILYLLHTFVKPAQAFFCRSPIK